MLTNKKVVENGEHNEAFRYISTESLEGIQQKKKEDINTNEKQATHPYERANIFSYIFTCWMVPHFKIGTKETLSESDIPDVPKSLGTTLMHDSLQHNLETYRAKNDRPSALGKALYRTFRREILQTFFMALIEDLVFEILKPISLGYLLNYLSHADEKPYWEGVLYIIGVFASTAVVQIMHHWAFFNRTVIALKTRASLSALVYRKALKLSQSSLKQVSVGQLVNYLSNDVRMFNEFTVFFPYVVTAPLQLLIFGYILWAQIRIAGIFGLLILILYLPLQSSMSKIYSKLRTQINNVTDQRISLMNEIMTGIKVIKMYAWEYAFADVVSKLRQKEYVLQRNLTVFRSLNAGISMISKHFIMLVTISIFVALTNEKLTPENVFVPLTIYNISKKNVTLFFQLSISSGSEVWSIIKRLYKFLNLEELTDVDESLKSSIKLSDVHVKFDKASFSWDKDEAFVLKNLSFKVDPQDLFVIIGQVGCGKSSLLMSIIGELSARKGNVSVNGKMAYISQEPWMFTGSIKDNILFGLPFERERYEEIIAVCALKTDLEQLPFGDDSLVGERGVLVSGGQKARISLARALYHDADIYVLDDPLSAVDAKISQHLFEKCIRSYLKNKMRILVTHQLQYVKYASQILILNEGKTLAIGTYEKLKNMDLDQFISHEDSEMQKRKKMRTNSVKSAVGSDENLETENELSGPVVEEEKRETGTVRWKVYSKFLLSGGGIGMLLLATITNVTGAALAIITDWYLSVWVDGEARNEDNSTMAEMDRDGKTWNHFHMFIMLSIASMIFLLIATAANYMLCLISARNLHNNMFSHLLHSPLSFFHKNPIGRILNRFTKDIGQIDDMMPKIFNDVMTLGLLCVSVVLMVAVVNYVVIFPTLLLLCAFIFLKKYTTGVLRDMKRLEGISKSPVFSHIAASMTGLSTIRSFKGGERFIRRFDELQNLNSAVWIMLLGAQRLFAILLDWIALFFVFAACVFSFVMSNTISAGIVGYVLSQVMQIAIMFQWTVRQTTEMETQMTSVERVLEYGDLPPEAPKESSPDKKPAVTWPTSGKIQLCNLSLKYDPMEPAVLKNISCEIKASEKIGIVGRTGAGKSSLISSLLRLQESEGFIRIDDIVVNDIGLHDLRKKISIIPQDPVLFSNTMRYNLDPFDEHSDDQLWDALSLVCLKEFISSFSSGLSTMLTEGGSNFSVGQRQLVCLARCLLKRNKILIIDEATANIDMATDALIQQTIRTQFKECTVLTIAHRLNTVIDSDKIMGLDDGRIIQFDTPKALLETKTGLFYSLVKKSNIDIEAIVSGDH